MYPPPSPPSPNVQPNKKRRIAATTTQMVTPSYATDSELFHSLPLTPIHIPPSATQIAQQGLLGLGDDLLVCVFDHFDVYELARLDRVCRTFRTMLNPTLPHPPHHHPTNTNEIGSMQTHNDTANYLWRNAALTKKAWPFPWYIDREHLERVVLKHLKSQNTQRDTKQLGNRSPPARDNTLTSFTTLYVLYVVCVCVRAPFSFLPLCFLLSVHSPTRSP